MYFTIDSYVKLIFLFINDSDKPHAETALVAKCAKYATAFHLTFSNVRVNLMQDPGQHTDHVVKNISYILYFFFLSNQNLQTNEIIKFLKNKYPFQ